MKKLAIISLLAPLAAFADQADSAAMIAAQEFAGAGNLAFGFSVLGSAIAIGLIGLGVANSIGRNPNASKAIMSGVILPMVLAEGLGIIAAILSFVK